MLFSVLLLSFLSNVFSTKNFLVQVKNINEASVSSLDHFFIKESEFIIQNFNIGDVNGYIMQYTVFPIHLYNYPFIDLIEEDHLINIFSPLDVSRHYIKNTYDTLNDFYYQDEEEMSKTYFLQQNPIWNLDRIDQRFNNIDSKYFYPSSSGKNVNVFIVDTGIDINHPEFQGNAVWGFNSADKINTDCNGHGTHVAGTVASKSYGVAKQSNLIAVKVLNCNGSGSYSGVIAGLEFSFKHHKSSNIPSILNMSLGGPKSVVLNRALAQLTSNGIHVVVAAGNENNDACNTSPASENTVTTVGATNKNSEFAGFSNWGKCVDILAPGVDILSTQPNKNTAVLSGSSMSTPHVSGIYALILSENSSFSPDILKKLVVSRCSKGKISNVKDGTPNCLAYSLS